MPRIARVSVGNTIYHVINRSNGRVKIFDTDKDYQHFEHLLEEGVTDTGMRILAYCVMPNHFHLILYPHLDGEMGDFMRWLTTTHVRQRRVQTKSIGTGHLYQGTYKSFPVETDRYLQTLIRYVEQNPLRARLVKRAEDWQWSSVWRREKGSAKQRELLAPLPTELPPDYLEWVNTGLTKDTLSSIRNSVNKGKPYGSDAWTDAMVEKFGLESTTRKPGRPRRV